MKAITVCVGYDDLLAITLPRFCRAFEEVLVVTTPEDRETAEIVGRFGNENSRLFTTDAFYRNGATFNKGLAIEEAFDVVGRSGWLCVVDADILLPAFIEEFIKEYFEPTAGTNLYSPRRRVLDNPRELNSFHMLDWEEFPLVGDAEHGGWLQIFHADDPHIRDLRPWYGTDWRHAGGCDSVFMTLWPPKHRKWLPWDVLHLGPVAQNWWGRATPRLDGREVEGAGEARQRMERMLADRRRAGRSGRRGAARFANEKVGAAAPMPPPAT